MQKTDLVIISLVFIGLSIGCKSFMPAKTVTSSGPPVDFTKPGKSFDVKVELDKAHTATNKVSPAGGSVSLTAADGSKFTLEVPPNAIARETEITMTAIKTLDGAPLDSNAPTAVQLEPSGSKFKETLTLTITPATEIPIEKQTVFGYENDGKDYHLMPVDSKSKEIKVKLLGFSAAGVGSSSDSAWASHLMIEASDASTRLLQKFGEVTQAERREVLLGHKEGASMAELADPFIDAFYDQVVMPEMAAAELDCKNAQRALDDLIYIERLAALANLPERPGSRDKMNRLLDIGGKCKKKSYRVEGSSGGASFKGDICSLDKPFTINVDSVTGKWPMNFTPEGEATGHMEGNFSSNGCTLTGGGPYNVSIGEEGSGTITFTYNSTASCPGVPSRATSRTSTLPLKPAPELSCP
jgi:hypothetical protein